MKKKRNTDYDFPPPLYVGWKKTKQFFVTVEQKNFTSSIEFLQH